MGLTDKVYGPYTRPDGRKHVIVIKNGMRRTVSYPKWLMEQHLGRELDPDLETVDHINDDFTDDRIENLQILTRVDHSRQDKKPAEMMNCICDVCGITFEILARQFRHNQENNGRKGPYCSRRCAGLSNSL